MILQSFRMAFSSILSNKMRSFLTMLGIIIGVTAVVVLISLVNGATSSVTSEIEGLGSNLLSVTIRGSRQPALTTEEIDTFPETMPGVLAVAPSLSITRTAHNGSREYDATIQGTTPAFAMIGSLEIEYGRFIKSPDVSDQTSVAVIGSDVAEELFGQKQVLGQSLSIEGRSFVIIGVLAEGESMFGGANQKIIIPFTVAQRMTRQNTVTAFFAAAKDSVSVDLAEGGLKSYLLAKYRQDEDAFSILNQSSILDAMDSISETLSLLLGGIAGISLLVGGIGIMNIMLVSVTERTREIGIRKAIGASRRRIMTQFLIEAIIISLLGGLIGLLISWLILSIVSSIASISFTMTAGVILLAVGFSVIVGVIFGLYPAGKASRLHPIQALRTE